MEPRQWPLAGLSILNPNRRLAMADDDSQTIYFDSERGEIVEFVNTSKTPRLLTFDFGPLGKVCFTVPIGGKFQYTPPSFAPRIFLDEAEVVVTGGNVVPLNKDE